MRHPGAARGPPEPGSTGQPAAGASLQLAETAVDQLPARFREIGRGNALMLISAYLDHLGNVLEPRAVAQMAIAHAGAPLARSSSAISDKVSPFLIL